jgi:hypothetical protein
MDMTQCSYLRVVLYRNDVGSRRYRTLDDFHVTVLHSNEEPARREVQPFEAPKQMLVDLHFCKSCLIAQDSIVKMS